MPLAKVETGPLRLCARYRHRRHVRPLAARQSPHQQAQRPGELIAEHHPDAYRAIMRAHIANGSTCPWRR
ncbi:hypothetical protein [Candidatus Accumulibacter sp. ACC003]|uniref:hypothetical protein n=1 Tax=Candidatus Accumulibacter sp. ACC003 TaxID=2823334 RepID=UPI0025C0F0F1|nr:hypothetical protein [Candidatus Accumulibacter sp. ACC003]